MGPHSARASAGAALGLLLAMTVPAGSEDPCLRSRERYLMGTLCRVSLTSRAPGWADDADAAFDTIAALERRMSTYDLTSELMRVQRGRHRGEPLELSRDLSDVLAIALAVAEKTRGAFDPTVGPLIEVWDLKGSGRQPDPSRIRRALRAVGWERVQHDPARRTLALTGEDTRLDLGGVGKGFALDRARDVLLARGVERALLDFGGQILVFGDTAWAVAVTVPGDRSVAAVEFLVRGLSVSTSDVSQRFVRLPDGTVLGHIVDPRTGKPVASADQATAFHPSAARADAYSTAALLMSPEEIGRLVEEDRELSVFVFRAREEGGGWRLETYNTDRLDPLVVKGSLDGIALCDGEEDCGSREERRLLPEDDLRRRK